MPTSFEEQRLYQEAFMSRWTLDVMSVVQLAINHEIDPERALQVLAPLLVDEGEG